MNRITRASLALLAPALAAALLAAPGAAEEPKPAETTVKVEGAVGGQYVDDLDGKGQARFEENRDVPKGFVFEYGRIELAPKDGGVAASLTMQDVGQDDQRYFLNVAAGRLSFDARYRELPHLYATSAKTLWSGVGTGRPLARLMKQVV